MRVSCVDCMKASATTENPGRQPQLAHMMIVMASMLKPQALCTCGDGITPTGIGGRAGVGEARS